MALSLTPDPPGADEPVAADASTRDRLLHAAYELLVERGYQATTVQAVARNAGLTTGAIYANFGGKQELMAHAVLDEWSRNERVAMVESLAPSGSDEGDAGDEGGTEPPVDAFTQMLAQHVAAPASDDHRLLTEVTGAIVREDISGSPLLVSVRFIEQITRATVEMGKARGEVSLDLDTEALVAVSVNVYLGAITSKSLGLPQPDAGEALKVLLAASAGYAAGWPPAD